MAVEETTGIESAGHSQEAECSDGSAPAAVLLAHPTGNQNARNLLLALAENEMLSEFWTSIAWDRFSLWNKAIPAGIRAQLLRRSFPEAALCRTHTAPSREMIRLCLRRLPLGQAMTSGELPFSTVGIYRHLDGLVARRIRCSSAKAVYAYEGGGLQSYRAAKQLGITSICEVQSSHWRWWKSLLEEEQERSPQYAPLLPGMAALSRHYAEKDEELRLAEVVFVPSAHVKKTLAGVVAEAKIRIVPYGAPQVRPHRPISRGSGEKLKVLYVGLLSQSKGIGYLLDAVDRMGSRVDLTMVGMRLRAHRRVDEACSRWRWIPSLPHDEVLALMQQAEVLVLPSLAEGCSLVVLEALACGLPVVVTPHSGSTDFIEDGRQGFMVPIRNSEAIAERLNVLAGDRQLLAEMSVRAQETATVYGWTRYRREMTDALKKVLCR